MALMAPRGAAGRISPLRLSPRLTGTVRLHWSDDVVIARGRLAAGERVPVEDIVVAGEVPAGHKVAARPISAGSLVRRYGQVIGVASRDIAPGEHVHSHNLAMTYAEREYEPGTDARPTAYVESAACFQGIRRPGGRVATRNFVAIISSVNCSATVVRAIADHFRRDIRPASLAEFTYVDGVVPITHGTGCALDPDGEGLAVLRRTLRGYARHPNFGGVLVVGLGCETNQIADLLAEAGPDDPGLIAGFNIQDAGGTTQAVRQGIAAVRQLLPAADEVRREPIPVSELIVGLQCGGSDGYSGITANPALGAAVDLLVSHGGTAILSETPEIYGAEHLLVRRARTPQVAQRLLDRFAWWNEYVGRFGGELDNNPSAGNKAGGLTTVLEKSLGGVTKSGTTALTAVYEYAEQVRERGLVFMDTPGFDPVSATGQVAGGANLICFTTGRGSAYGCQPSPSLKLSSNTALWERQRDDIDLDCGQILEGEETVEQAGARIFDLMIACASGERSRSERHGYGQNEFVPWQLSAVM
jgi:altronate hydrolase